MPKGCAHWLRSVRNPNQKNLDEKTGASCVPPKYKVPQWASHLDLAKVVFCCQLPQGVGRVERIFTSKTAPGIYSISPFSSFSPYFTITGFQSCDSVSGIDGCNQNVARVNYKNLKYWAVSSRVTLSYLQTYHWFIRQCWLLALLLFLANSSSSLTVFILLLPHPLSSGPQRRQVLIGLSHWSVPMSAASLRFYPLKALQETTLSIFKSFLFWNNYKLTNNLRNCTECFHIPLRRHTSFVLFLAFCHICFITLSSPYILFLPELFQSRLHISWIKCVISVKLSNSGNSRLILCFNPQSIFRFSIFFFSNKDPAQNPVLHLVVRSLNLL